MKRTNIPHQKPTSVLPHPYLSGNFAPVSIELPLTECTVIGTIPSELAGGQYVRNGANPLANDDGTRDAHWFDGDGMLAGVFFCQDHSGAIRPHFVNRFVVTDVFAASAGRKTPLAHPFVISISTMSSILRSPVSILIAILRTFILAVLSWLPGLAPFPVKRISVANTAILYHDGRALATCESGPPMRVLLPGLETIGWWSNATESGSTKGHAARGLARFMREWTTGHPKVDPISGEFIAFHNTVIRPYISYSVIPPSRLSAAGRSSTTAHSQGAENGLQPSSLISLAGAPIQPSPSSPKMSHDFGVSLTHTVLVDPPLLLDPLNLLRGKPILTYDTSPEAKLRFGVFKRYSPHDVHWVDTHPGVVLHVANTWDEYGDEVLADGDKNVVGINMLVPRMNSASLVYATGNIPSPHASLQQDEETDEEGEPEECTLHYFYFSLPSSGTLAPHNTESDTPPTSSTSHLASLPTSRASSTTLLHSFPISAIPLELPTVSPHTAMRCARYIYGCTMREGTFSGGKVQCLAKFDVLTLIDRGKRESVSDGIERRPVDQRSVQEIIQQQLEAQQSESAIKIFNMPPGWCCQEATFVPRTNQQSYSLPASSDEEEDDGWLLSYVFDESQLDGAGMPRADARSELWIIDARNMKDVVARIVLPQRVPYGFHGSFFTEDQIAQQQPIDDIRHSPTQPCRHHFLHQFTPPLIC
ncbi:carotenoid oxygenase [Clavulina sp. PMI_390]|nr:carotenoid oxygenase [Clavulina sp. PMI_390]